MERDGGKDVHGSNENEVVSCSQTSSSGIYGNIPSDIGEVLPASATKGKGFDIKLKCRKGTSKIDTTLYIM